MGSIVDLISRKLIDVHAQTSSIQGVRLWPACRPGRIAGLWVDAWNDQDADRLALLFERDAEFVNVTGLWCHDHQAIRQAHAYEFDTIFSEPTITLLEKRVMWMVGTPEGDENAAGVVHAKMKREGQTPIGDVASGEPSSHLSFVEPRTGGRTSLPTIPTWFPDRRRMSLGRTERCNR